MNVRPKLFQLVTDEIPPNLRSQNVEVTNDRPGRGMVRIGDNCGHTITEKFREVELIFSRVRADDQNPQAAYAARWKKFPFPIW